MKRLFIVYNPRSSRFLDVKKEVLDKTKSLKGYMVGKYEVEPTDVDENAKNLAKILKDGDLVLSAGGDATASISANGILRSNKDVTLAVLPYGNFNDLARTLGAKKFEDLFIDAQDKQLETIPDQRGGERASEPRNDGRERSASRVVCPSVSELFPLEIHIDGKFFRYATCYVTIGMTAEACELFDEPRFRKSMQKGHKSSWRSYLALVKWYFKNRRKKQFIPDFKLNGKLQHKKTSDYAAVSGKSMCRVMKGGDDYHDPIVFRSMTDRLTNFWRLFKLMTKSILIRTPGVETEGDKLEFIKPSTVELQAEGEYRTFKNIKTIEIKKGKKCLKVIEI